MPEETSKTDRATAVVTVRQQTAQRLRRCDGSEGAVVGLAGVAGGDVDGRQRADPDLCAEWVEDGKEKKRGAKPEWNGNAGKSGSRERDGGRTAAGDAGSAAGDGRSVASGGKERRSGGLGDSVDGNRGAIVSGDGDDDPAVGAEGGEGAAAEGRRRPGDDAVRCSGEALAGEDEVEGAVAERQVEEVTGVRRQGTRSGGGRRGRDRRGTDGASSHRPSPVEADLEGDGVVGDREGGERRGRGGRGRHGRGRRGAADAGRNLGRSVAQKRGRQHGFLGVTARIFFFFFGVAGLQRQGFNEGTTPTDHDETAT